MAEISFLKMDIAGLVMEYAKLGGAAATDAALAAWFRSWVEAIATRDPTAHAYAASLLGEAEAYRQAEAQRKKRAKESAKDPVRSKESALSLDSALSLERHYNQPTNQPIRKEEESASGYFSSSTDLSERKDKEGAQVTKTEVTKHFHPWLQNEMFLAAWDGWLLSRKKQRKAPTEQAKEIAMEKLVGLSGGDMELAMEHVREAIEAGWLTFFPLRSQKQAATSSRNKYGFV